MSRPLVSVVTVVRNDRDGLERTVDSVVSQVWPDVEYLVIDGASTDGTVEWLVQNRARIRGTFVTEADRGIYDAMNKGISRASGDLVVFMNAGDRFAHAETISRVARHWASHHWEWAYGAVRWMRDGTPVKVVRQEPYSLKAFARGRMWVPHQSTYVLRETLVRLGGFRATFGVGADQELLMRVAKLSHPQVFSEVLSDFELDGAHSSLSIWQRELAWRRMRQANFGAGWLDLAGTVGVAGYLSTRHRIGRLLRSRLNLMRS